jgi:hypothetical protein
MAKADVLDAVSSDLASGRTQPAIQRLGSLVATHPTDLDLRRRLASVHRLVGNPVEAGRWDYLRADADPDEVRAFERAFPSPAARLRKLRWPARDAHAATEFARHRLAELADAAVTTGPGSTALLPDTGRPLETRRPLGALLGRFAAGPRPVAFPGRRYAVAAGLIASPFAVLGAVTVVQWIVG